MQNFLEFGGGEFATTAATVGVLGQSDHRFFWDEIGTTDSEFVKGTDAIAPTHQKSTDSVPTFSRIGMLALTWR